MNATTNGEEKGGGGAAVDNIPHFTFFKINIYEQEMEYNGGVIYTYTYMYL